MADALFLDDDYCFACGTKNPLGLHLKFFTDGDRLCTRVRPGPHWQGYRGVLHGGLQSTIFDDLMSNHLFRLHRVWNTTAELSLRFKQPVSIAAELLFCSRVESQRGRVWTMGGECRLAAKPEASPLTIARGRFVELTPPA